MLNVPLPASAAPETLAQWVQRGHDLKSKELLAKAVEAYLQAIQVDGSHADAWRFLGNACYKLGRFSQARDAYEASSRLNPDELKIWMNLANTYEHLGMRLESESCRNKGNAMIESSHSIHLEKK